MEHFSVFLQPYDRVIGFTGVAVYIGSYFAVQAGLIRGQGFIYPILNLMAAFLVSLTIINEFNLPSLLIQLSWIAISLIGITRLLYHRVSRALTSEEAAFLKATMPHLPDRLARRFLDAGSWRIMKAGSVLQRQGESAEYLTYVAEGKARVVFHGEAAYVAGGGEFVGEDICLSDEPAIATVQLITEAYCFSIETETLRRLAQRSAELRVSLELCFAREIKEKLRKVDRRIVTVPASQIRKDGLKQSRQATSRLAPLPTR